jgi:hypothetical protein
MEARVARAEVPAAWVVRAAAVEVEELSSRTGLVKVP